MSSGPWKREGPMEPRTFTLPPGALARLRREAYEAGYPNVSAYVRMRLDLEPAQPTFAPAPGVGDTPARLGTSVAA